MTDPADGVTLTISEAAAAVGLTAYTLRWYEQEGLVAPVGRDSAGRRRYTRDDLNRLVLLNRLRRTGMPVRDMRRYTEQLRLGDQTVRARRELLEAHRARVLGKIAQLKEDLSVLNDKIEMYDRLERELAARSTEEVPA